MRKIPTLFRRDPEDMRYLTREVHPDCQWVLDGEGMPTRKYDGTCMKLDERFRWFARREVKPGKPVPPGFIAEQTDEATRKTVGWEPVDQSPFAKYLNDALDESGRSWTPGTYELCGPKVQGNPEGYTVHTLVSHADAEQLDSALPRDYDSLAAILTDPTWMYEGIVFHHPDGRMAKIKRRDFRRAVAG